MVLFALGCGPMSDSDPSGSDSSASGARGSGVEESPAIVYSDTLRAVLDRLAAIVAPVEAWRERALAELRADSGAAWADTLFLRLRLEGQTAVRHAAQSFNDRSIQAVVYPDGAWAGVLRRERIGEYGQPDSLELARADTIIDWLHAHGLWTFRAEGDAYIVLDDQELLESFGPFVGVEIREFLSIRAHDQQQRIAGDASLLVAPDELARRITELEQYLANHPASPVQEAVATQYNWYLWIYLGGLPNTPAFDRRTGVLRGELRDSFEKYVTERPSSPTAAIVSEYLAMLARSGFTRSAEVERFIATRYEAFDTHLLGY